MNVNVDRRLFNPVYLKLFDSPQPLIHCYGGGSSGKSRAIGTFIVLYALRGEAILIARQTLVSIRKSTWLELRKIIFELELEPYFKFNKSDFTIESVSGGSIQFVGCEDIERVKSITPLHRSSFSKLWVEEATEVSKDSLTQLRIRMRGKSKWNKQTILTYNPIHKGHYLFKDYFEPIGWTESNREHTDDSLLILKTTYKDNKFLDQSEIDFLESLKKTTPYFYEVYAKGNFGTLGSRIFENWVEEHFNAEDLNLPFFGGGDFGFSIDPSTLIYSKYDEKSKTIYIFDEIYDTGMTNDMFAKCINDKNKLNKLYNPAIYFDSAEPKSIQELKNYGVNSHASKKGKDSIHKGIDWLLQHRIIVHPKCVKTIEELQLYVRKEKNGEVQLDPEDKNNHLMDALRYAYNNKWQNFNKPNSYRNVGIY